MHIFAREIKIGSKTISSGSPCFIIAEAGLNHNGSMDLAKKLIDAAVAVGADAIKFQTFRAEEENTAKTPKASYQKDEKNKQESYIEMIKKLEFGEKEYRTLMNYCQNRGIVFLSTPSEEVSADLLQRLGVPAFKIASNDI